MKYGFFIRIYNIHDFSTRVAQLPYMWVILCSWCKHHTNKVGERLALPARV